MVTAWRDLGFQTAWTSRLGNRGPDRHGQAQADLREVKQGARPDMTSLLERDFAVELDVQL